MYWRHDTLGSRFTGNTRMEQEVTNCIAYRAQSLGGEKRLITGIIKYKLFISTTDLAFMRTCLTHICFAEKNES